MVEDTILTPDVIATIIGLIVTVGGGTAAAIIAGIGKYLTRGIDFATLLRDALKDGKITPEEVKDIMDGFMKLIRQDPDASRELLNSRK